MPYGYLIKNSAGKDIVQGDEIVQLQDRNWVAHLRFTGATYYPPATSEVLICPVSEWSRTSVFFAPYHIDNAYEATWGVTFVERYGYMYFRIWFSGLYNSLMSYKVYVFQEADLVAKPSWGMEVRNASSKTVWHTGSAPLEPVGFIPFQYHGPLAYAPHPTFSLDFNTYAIRVDGSWWKESNTNLGYKNQVAQELPYIRRSDFD